MPLTTQPLADNPILDRVRETLAVNVPTAERAGSVAAGAALIVYGVSKRSIGGLVAGLLGVALVRRGAIGHCAVYEKLGINSGPLNAERGVPGNKGINVEKSVTIDRPAQAIYRFWRNLENLPRFFEHVESVSEIDHERSHWTVRGPAGTHVKWTAQIVTDHEGELISWESLPGADVQNAGSVRFESIGDGSSTRVKVALQYQPPAGVIGATIAKLFGEAPDQQLDKDLGRLKELVDRESRTAARV